ncbi:deSI-like protein At4g17486 [Silene latifolia]|uniref:deSI-like protein At4g17486 n=1 Tax=Silene latifolia TaxID=37657 RepID=UPI003D77A7A4
MKLKSKNGAKSVKPARRKGKLASRLCLFPKVKSVDSLSGYTPVYLNVYDLTPVNGYMYWAGLGVFHTGVEVHGSEYAFGAHDYPTSGVFEIEPRKCPGFKFRKSIFMGMTALNPSEVREFMEEQSCSYYGDTYHLIIKNCNHFCDDMCSKLTGRRIPKWVNRLAKIGSVCNCILPDGLKVTTVPEPHLQVLECDDYESEKKHLRTFSCFSSFSMSPKEKEEPISSLFLNSHYRECLSP